MALNLNELQASLRQNNARWQAIENDVSRLPEAEQQLRLGAVPPEGMATLEARELRSSELLKLNFPHFPIHLRPPAWDWRHANGGNFVTAVRDQKNCGSCVSFGCCAAVECTWQVQVHNPNLHPDLSEADLFYCQAAKQGRNCSNGWWPNQALAAFVNPGIVDEACFPYTPGNQPCHLCADSANRQTKISGFHSLSNADDMKAWLSTRGALSTCFTVYQDFLPITPASTTTSAAPRSAATAFAAWVTTTMTNSGFARTVGDRRGVMAGSSRSATEKSGSMPRCGRWRASFPITDIACRRQHLRRRPLPGGQKK